jgi:hypothetical protein
MENVKGVVAVLVGPDGRHLADASDFHSGAPAGFSQQEAQTIRVRDRLAMNAMRELTCPVLYEVVDVYTAKRIVDQMCSRGCREIITPIGYGSDDIGEDDE